MLITNLKLGKPGKSYSASVQILESETLSNIDIIPFDTWESELITTVEKGPLYNQAIAFPENIISISDPIIMRGLVMVQVSLTPFQYNPITKNLTVIQISHRKQTLKFTDKILKFEKNNVVNIINYKDIN